jgi:hypothetical protein
MSECARRQTLITKDDMELIDIINTALSCELLIHFKIYALWNGELKRVYDAKIYDSLRCYKFIEWIYESRSGKIKCLLNVHSYYAFLTLWTDYAGDFLPKCKVIISNSRKDLLSSVLSINKYEKYIQDTQEYIEIIIKN